MANVGRLRNRNLSVNGKPQMEPAEDVESPGVAPSEAGLFGRIERVELTEEDVNNP
jgi:hypothetical protein